MSIIGSIVGEVNAESEYIRTLAQIQQFSLFVPRPDGIPWTKRFLLVRIQKES
jgi:hypothetical protein